MTDRPVLVMPLGDDLTPISKGPVRCGPGTMAACDLALRIAQQHAGSYILVTPTNAGKEYARALMWAVMDAYLATHHPSCAVVHQQADRFNTLGEILALVAYIKFMREHGVEFSEVALVAKDWHAKRVERLATEAFVRFGILTPIRIETYHTPGRTLHKTLEPFKTQRHLWQLRAIALTP